MADPVFRVSELLAVLNQTLEYAYPSVTVEGEIASYKISKGKYVFFDIKDEQGVVPCFMMVYSLRQPLEDGMMVRLTGQPRVTAWGKFSITVRQVAPIGEGSLKRSFDVLHAALLKEGLFNAERKRTLPVMPKAIGLITSAESAGYADFIKILNHRFGGVDVQVANVHVQGAHAAPQIINALQYFNQQDSPPDIIVIIRGGGSAEDLAVFNDEPLVRAVAASRAPTVVGVGHETDTSLCDLAADVRAATPSNAAQIVVPDRHAFIAHTAQSQKSLYNYITAHIADVNKIASQARVRMATDLQAAIAAYGNRLMSARRLLAQCDPKAALQRGYALVQTVSGKSVTTAADTKPGDMLTITLARAILNVEVRYVKSSKR